MSKTEEKYNKLVIERAIKKAEEKEISPFVRELYEACKNRLNIGLEKFAAYTANWSPAKTRAGEDAQMEMLQEKYPSIKRLPNGGDESVKLWDTGNGISVKEGKGKSNIPGIKSFDAVIEKGNKYTFFVLKTRDIGSYSENRGGGHQDNVYNEIVNLVNVARGKKIYFKNKEIEIRIMVDGRTSDEILKTCRTLLQGFTGITVDSCG